MDTEARRVAALAWVCAVEQGTRPDRQPPLPPLDSLLPAHVEYVSALVGKLAITPTHEREDLVQEILIQAHRSRHSTIEARPLLFGITRHVVHRWIASQQAEHTAIAGRHQQVCMAPEPPGTEEQCQAAERVGIVVAVIAELPKMFRDILVQTQLEEATVREVAEAAGIPESTAYTRLHLARARFAEGLRRYLARRRLRREDL